MSGDNRFFNLRGFKACLRKGNLLLMKWYPNNLAELVCLIIAIIYYPYLKKSFMRWVLPFMMVIFFGELYTKYEGEVLGGTTIIPNYIIGIVESIFYGYVFYSLGRNQFIKKLILILITISILCYIGSLIFFPSSHDLLYINLVISGLILSFVSLVYLYLKFLDDDPAYLIEEPEFWIAFGVSIFFSGVCIVFSLHNIIIENNLTVFGLKLHHIVPRVLSIVLYLSISIAIIQCKKKTKISL